MEYSITIPDDLLAADLSVILDELNILIQELGTQRKRIQDLQTAASQVEAIQQSFHVAAEGSVPPTPPIRTDSLDLSRWREWRQPRGAHDAYPKDWILVHNGVLYKSVRHANVWEPGTTDSGWEDVTPAPGEPIPDAPDAISYVDWVEWTQYKDGTNDVDSEGNLLGRDYVSYKGIVYGCVQSHRSQPDWAPDLTPALWVEIGPVTPDPVDPIDPDPANPENPDPVDPIDPDPAPSVEIWVQPLGGHDAYAIDDVVTHKGQTWISTAASNVWEPGVYGWEVVTP